MPFAFGSSTSTGRDAVASLPKSASATKLMGRGTPAGAHTRHGAPPREPLPAPRPFSRDEAWLRPQSAPSAKLPGPRRVRAHGGLLRRRLVCPTAAIERALLVPDDLPKELCMQALPKLTHMRFFAAIRGRDAGQDRGKGKGRQGQKGQGPWQIQVASQEEVNPDHSVYVYSTHEHRSVAWQPSLPQYS